MRNIFTLLLFIAFWVHAEKATCQEEENSCILCHPAEQASFSQSVHSSAGYLCTTCHGGNPKELDPDAAMSKDAGFVGIPDKKGIVTLCGECHSNVEEMNPFGLPTDQLAQYKTSVHGKRVLNDGDINPAVCSDCHGFHKVLKAKDPASPVYPTNLASTCNNCHGDKALMDSYGLDSTIFEQYKKSVHGQALFEKGDLSVANCASCHGSHGAMPPGVNKVGATCGKCHINEKKHFLKSPHAKLVEGSGFAECDSCHGHHDVTKASLDLYKTACSQCHLEGSEALGLGLSFRDMLHADQEILANAEEVIQQAAREGMFVDEETALLEEIKTEVVVLAPEQHSLILEKITSLSASIAKGAEEIVSKIDEKRQFLQWRKIALIPVWIFLITMIIAFGKVIIRMNKEPLQEKTSRRDFLSWILKGGLFVLILGFLAPAISYILPIMRRGPLKNMVKACNVDELAVWGVKKVIIAGSAVLVIRTPKGYKALSAICTHLGCIVAFNREKLEIECPCHAATFNVEGKVISGPPPRPLPSYEVKIIGKEVFVQL